MPPEPNGEGPVTGRPADRPKRDRALGDFESAIAFGENRTAVTMALAEAGARGESLTLAEAHQHTDVSASTVRQVLTRLEEMQLVEQTTKAGRMAFRFTDYGLTGYFAWQAKEDSIAAMRDPGPARTTPIYRWRVWGSATHTVAFDPETLRADTAATGIDLVRVGDEASLLVEATYEVDALDKDHALILLRDSGWSMQSLATRVEMVGLAANLAVRPGHRLELHDTDAAGAIARVRTGVRERVNKLRTYGSTHSLIQLWTDAEDTVIEFLEAAVAADSGTPVIELPDDDRLMDAIETLWHELDQAGARAVGEAFMVSERELREQTAKDKEEHGDVAGVASWDDMLARALDKYREQGRLAP